MNWGVWSEGAGGEGRMMPGFSLWLWGCRALLWVKDEEQKLGQMKSKGWLGILWLVLFFININCSFVPLGAVYFDSLLYQRNNFSVLCLVCPHVCKYLKVIKIFSCLVKMKNLVLLCSLFFSLSTYLSFSIYIPIWVNKTGIEPKLLLREAILCDAVTLFYLGSFPILLLKYKLQEERAQYLHLIFVPLSYCSNLCRTMSALLEWSAKNFIFPLCIFYFSFMTVAFRF